MLNLDSFSELCRETGAQIALSEPMSAHPTFRVGGPCAALVTGPDIPALQAIVRNLTRGGIPFRLIGRGSNLLVPDEGYPGVVLLLGGTFAGEIVREGDSLICGAGTPLKNLCLAALNHGLTGMEFAYGIPGSAGGAVYMNAGAYGPEMKDVLLSVTAMDPDGSVREIPASALQLSYRHSVFMEQSGIVLRVTVGLTAGDPEAIRARMQELLGRRQEKQPLEFPSAGSTFKRPVGAYASQLIDECGLKGYRVGGAQVSEKHAGFVVNRGGATFADIMAVCRHVQETVRAQTGFSLELEPEIMRV